MNLRVRSKKNNNKKVSCEITHIPIRFAEELLQTDSWTFHICNNCELSRGEICCGKSQGPPANGVSLGS